MKKTVHRFKGNLVKMVKDINDTLMIVQYHLKLDKFYCIGIMN